ncbi:MAG TPA: 3'(2'),5'-bisphosphate nucleotidase CysQ [Xanthobacteraceae bacterium]|nr:3'(2'),5'-bisphosphate nucleotidase CysQ [Xanthobacteraceae bacterium]
MIDASTLDRLACIAIAAGMRILRLDRGSIAATAKADGSPVTQADLDANDEIVKGLAEQFPQIPVVSEESSPSDDAGARFVFMVDPLDGTKEFLRGADEFTVNIAMLDGASPIAGVVYAPALQVIYAGAAGQGARRAAVTNGAAEAWQAIRAVSPAGPLRVVASRSHRTPETQHFIDRYPVANTVSIGSSLKFCLLAAGEADLYPRMGATMEWDTAAGDAILRAAGGTVCTLDRQPLQYRKAGTAACGAFTNPWFVAAGAFDPFDARWHSGNATAAADTR